MVKDVFDIPNLIIVLNWKSIFPRKHPQILPRLSSHLSYLVSKKPVQFPQTRERRREISRRRRSFDILWRRALCWRGGSLINFNLGGRLLCVSRGLSACYYRLLFSALVLWVVQEAVEVYNGETWSIEIERM